MTGVQHQELSFIVIEFKLIGCHPTINVMDTCFHLRLGIFGFTRTWRVEGHINLACHQHRNDITYHDV